MSSPDYKKYKYMMLWAREAREFEIKEPNLEFDEFLKEIAEYGYIAVAGIAGDDFVLCVYIVFGSSVVSISDDFTGMMNQIFKRNKPPKGKRTKVFLFFHAEPTDFVRGKFKTYENCVFRALSHNDILCDKRNGPMCFPHDIVPPDQVEHILEYFAVTKKEMRTMCRDDARLVWTKAEVGDLIAVTRYENTSSGTSLEYHVVTNAPFNKVKKDDKTTEANSN